MKRLSRYALALLLTLPLAGLVTGCGEAPKKERDVAERNTRDEPAALEPAPAEPAKPVKGEAKDDEWMDAVGRGRSPGASSGGSTDGLGAGSSGSQTATGDGEDSHAHRSPPKTAAPPPSPTKPAQPAPPAVIEEAPPEMAGAESPAARAPAEPGGISSAETSPPPPPAAPAGGAAPPSAQPPSPPPAPADQDKAMAPETSDGSRSLSAAAGDKNFDVVPVYYGTDRAVEADPARLKFGADRGHRLQLGRALVTVPTAHKVPAIERPWVIEIPYFKVKVYEEAEDPAKHFTLQEIKSLTKEELMKLVKERLAKSAAFKDHALVFVHGFNTSFDYALYRTAQIAYDLKFDGAPFVYSWPSGGKVASYTYDRGSAEQAEPHLAEFLDIVVKESGAKSISLIAHSMGNEVLLRVLQRMRPKAPKGVVISQVILAAPDVDRDKFDNIAREITGFAKGVTLYAASNDRALRYSASFWGGIPRAGDVPTGGPLIVPGVDTIDVSAVSTDSLGLNHSGYAENNALLNDIKLLIQTGERPPDKRIPILQAVKTDAGGAYWRYPPAQ